MARTVKNDLRTSSRPAGRYTNRIRQYFARRQAAAFNTDASLKTSKAQLAIACTPLQPPTLAHGSRQKNRDAAAHEIWTLNIPRASHVPIFWQSRLPDRRLRGACRYVQNQYVWFPMSGRIDCPFLTRIGQFRGRYGLRAWAGNPRRPNQQTP